MQIDCPSHGRHEAGGRRRRRNWRRCGWKCIARKIECALASQRVARARSSCALRDYPTELETSRKSKTQPPQCHMPPQDDAILPLWHGVTCSLGMMPPRHDAILPLRHDAMRRFGMTSLPLPISRSERRKEIEAEVAKLRKTCQALLVCFLACRVLCRIHGRCCPLVAAPPSPSTLRARTP